jgi:hypothetical protein
VTFWQAPRILNWLLEFWEIFASVLNCVCFFLRFLKKFFSLVPFLIYSYSARQPHKIIFFSDVMQLKAELTNSTGAFTALAIVTLYGFYCFGNSDVVWILLCIFVCEK